MVGRLYRHAPHAGTTPAGKAAAVVFTVGLGQDVDVPALAAMASRPEYAYLAPDAEDLAGIYRAIAVTIPCPAGWYWGNR